MCFYIIRNRYTKEVLCVCLDEDYAKSRKINYEDEGIKVDIHKELMLTFKDGKIQ